MGQMHNDLLPPVDVDSECLADLEHMLFENSLAAGPAGNRQWGLDAGPHQYSWDPYVHFPPVGNRSNKAIELRVSKFFDSNSKILTALQRGKDYVSEDDQMHLEST